jgi:hypothetical protein
MPCLIPAPTGITFFIASVKDLDLAPVRDWVRRRDTYHAQYTRAR